MRNRARALEARRRASGAPAAVEIDSGHIVHVRGDGATISILGYEVLGSLSMPRKAVPSFIDALRRAAEEA